MPRFTLSPCHLVTLSLCFCVTSGCSSTDNKRASTDPLSSPAGSGGSSGTAAMTGSILAAPIPAEPAVPAMPVASGGTPSTAALAAGGGPKPLTGGTDLRIGAAPAGAWQGQNKDAATLRQPEPTVQPVARARGVAGGRITSYEQAMSVLTTRGVKWRRLETVENNESKFTCSIPSPQNPAVSRTYEARAANDLAAIQAVLDQIDRDVNPGGL